MKKQKLSKTQFSLLDSVAWSNSTGYSGYIETGMYKPFSVNTLRSLINRGLVVNGDMYSGGVGYGNTVFNNIWLTEEGVNYYIANV